MTAHPVRSGTQKVCDLPDAGPWEIEKFQGIVFLASRISGVWILDEGGLHPLRSANYRPMFTGDL